MISNQILQYTVLITDKALTNLAKAHEAVYYSGIKIFNNLPLIIKQSSHDTNLNWP